MTQARLKAPAAVSQAMRPLPQPAPRSLARTKTQLRPRRALRPIVLALMLGIGAVAALPARAAQPFIWDQDGNGIDDRIELVHVQGYSLSFELGDTTLRQRILV